MEKLTLVIGASQNPERFSYKAIISLQQMKIPVVAIGRRDVNTGDLTIMKGMPADIGTVHTITLYLSAKNQKEYYNYIFSLRPKRIIFNPGTTNPELSALAVREGIEVIDDCILVMLNGVRYMASSPLQGFINNFIICNIGHCDF
jgi:predicted CoA-binding protein